ATEAKDLGSMLRFGIDAHHALRGVEGLASHRLADFAHVVLPGFLDRLSPEVYAEVGGFHGIGNDALLAVPGLKAFDELVILRSVHGLKIVPGRVVADKVLHAQAAQLFFRDAEGDRWSLARRDTGGAQGAEEGHVTVAVDGVQDGVGPGSNDLAHKVT